MNLRATLRRWDASGLPLLLARLVLGATFTVMGLAKTGVPSLVLERTGWKDSPAVKAVLASDVVALTGPVEFLKQMRQYRIFGDQMWPLMNLTAVALPWVETLCGLLLLAGVAVRGAALMLLAMLLAFTPMVLLRGLELQAAGGLTLCQVRFDCGCGAGEVALCAKLAENTAMILLSVLALVSSAERLCLRRRLLPA